MSSRRDFLQGAASGLALAGLVAPKAVRAAETAGAFDVRSMGATGDGKTIDSPAIDKAIAAASTAGGGTVHFPAGDYLSYTIHLKSNVVLYLDQGARIIAADSPAAGDTGTKAYDLAEPNPWDKFQDYGHSHWRNSLIWGEAVENVSILGPGLIWGRGLSQAQLASVPGPVEMVAEAARGSMKAQVTTRRRARRTDRATVLAAVSRRRLSILVMLSGRANLSHADRGHGKAEPSPLLRVQE